MTNYLKDLLPKDKEISIMYRCNAPYDDEEDMLYGYAYWDGRSLEGEDGDNYSLNDIVDVYRWKDDTSLTVWISVEWSGNNYED